MKLNFLRSLSRMFLIWALVFAVQACNNDPSPEIPVGSAGYFVVNEGGYDASNTSISFYDRATDSLINNVFATKNGRPLGDQAQSATVFEGKVYIAVQNSSKVEVINADDFSSIKTITEGIVSPRYFIGVSSAKGYVSDWGADGLTGTVKVIDLNSLSVTKTIATGKGASKMVMKDGKVYVANNGGFGTDNTISIIDTSTDEVISTITTGDNPNSLALDNNGNIWVAGMGNFIDTNPWVGKIGTDNNVAFKLDLPKIVYIPTSIAMNNAGDKFYYNYDGSVYAMPTSATTLPASIFIDHDFYGLAVDPLNDNLIGCDANGFSAVGAVYIYDTNGTLKKSYQAGIAPNGVAFK